MKVVGLCAVCERPGTLRTCIACGRIVCERHIDPESARCPSCRTG